MQSEQAIHDKLIAIEKELNALRKAFGTAVAWIAQSSTGVLSVSDAEKLIKMSEE